MKFKHLDTTALNTTALDSAPLMKSLRFLAAAMLIAIVMSGCAALGIGTGADGSGSGTLSEAELEAQREARFGSGEIPTAEGEGYFRDINFDYDSALLSDHAMQNIEYNYEVIKANPDIKVILEGHCDERGTTEYNMALGNKRARAVRDVLVSLGMPSTKVETISYGSEIPLDPGSDEIAYAKNRRVHFSPTRDR